MSTKIIEKSQSTTIIRIITITVMAALFMTSIFLLPMQDHNVYASSKGSTVKVRVTHPLEGVITFITYLENKKNGKEIYASSYTSFTKINGRKLTAAEKKILKKQGSQTIFVYNKKTKKLSVETASKYYKETEDWNPGINDLYYNKNGNVIRFGSMTYFYLDKNFNFTYGSNPTPNHKFTLTGKFTFKKVPKGTYKLVVEGKTKIKNIKVKKVGKLYKLKNIKVK